MADDFASSLIGAFVRAHIAYSTTRFQDGRAHHACRPLFSVGLNQDPPAFLASSSVALAEIV